MTTTISESKAAEILGVSRQGLALWRRKGLLPAGVIVERLDRPVGQGAAVHYDADRINAAADGTLPLFAPAE